MLLPDKLPMPGKALPPGRYSEEAIEAMRAIHNSFAIMTEKLKDARKRKHISDKAYYDWLHCFDMLQKDWLNREVKTVEDVQFLQYMAKSSAEESRESGVVSRQPECRN